MGCTTHGDYPTEMDNAEEWDGFSCEIWSACLEGNEFVSCVGNFPHGWPYIDTAPDTAINVTMQDLVGLHEEAQKGRELRDDLRPNITKINGNLNHVTAGKQNRFEFVQ